MKQCPACNRTYTDDELLFCLEDGAQLQSIGFGGSDAPTSIDANYDPNKTLAFSSPARETNPPPTNVYVPPPVSQPQGQPRPQQQWSPTPSFAPTPSLQAARKGGGKGLIIAAIAGVVVLGIGIVVLLMIIGRDNSKESNTNRVAANKNSNSVTTNANTANRNSTSAPAGFLKDDFSAPNWPTGDNAFGSFYEDGEYHMKGKPNLYVYMFPFNGANYLSKDADVKVTARSVDGKSPEYGYGLVMHGKTNSNSKLVGYGFLVYTGTGPKYEIVKFEDGNPSTLVKWESAAMLRTGTTPNQLEVRAQGSQLSFYINGQFVKSITDTSNITDGSVGLYTSETNEVAFDDMEISR
ncbi:MAG TPA: hypothetical protein VEV81_07785 [Pyrinomonadaceae bacterium]|nr:hypothetical protein [Pyrinomonadaceae bacterium]